MPWEPLPGSRPEPRPLSGALDRVVGSLGGPGAATLGVVFGRWHEVVGDDVAAHAEPQSLRDHRLLVAVDDPVWATELRFREPDILAALAAVAGPDEVVALDVRVRGRGAG